MWCDGKPEPRGEPVGRRHRGGTGDGQGGSAQWPPTTLNIFCILLAHDSGEKAGAGEAAQHRNVCSAIAAKSKLAPICRDAN